MAGKASIVKKVLGPMLEKEGFRYKGYKRVGNDLWQFERRDGEWLQLLKVVGKTTLKYISISIDEIKPEENPWSPNGFDINFFAENLHYEAMKFYRDGESFEQALKELVPMIQQYFLPGFAKLRAPRYQYCVTAQMERRVYEERAQLAEKIREKYGLEESREDELLKFLTDIISHYKGSAMEEFAEIFQELSAYLGESIIKYLGGYCWIWDEHRKECRLGQIGQTEYFEKTVEPMWIIFCEWQSGLNVEWWYQHLFINERKARKAVRMRELEKPEKAEWHEWTYMDRDFSVFMEGHGFCYGGWVGKEDGYRFYREKGGGQQELWVKRGWEEIWVMAYTAEGRALEQRDRKEGLEPCGGIHCCCKSDYFYFIHIAGKLKEEIEKEFLPMLEQDGQGWTVPWELTPEQARRQFYERKGLLEGLREKYAIDRVSQEQMPEFIKNVLEENGDRSMEEFGDTLLGLGIWLGETAIGKKKGRHWLWDQRHGVCIVSQGDEPSGIAPSLALNYAWQKKKPENVDRLCRLLLDDWE
ncbi:MAG: hypothetical protein MR430_00905 [Lachnospiraceae bacterium]|nr:hypothetical protein [Lachnospiraceae bacterium]